MAAAVWEGKGGAFHLFRAMRHCTVDASMGDTGIAGVLVGQAFRSQAGYTNAEHYRKQAAGCEGR
jgi:hypothetical protein